MDSPRNGIGTSITRGVVYLTVSDHVQQRDNVRPAGEVLQNLDLPFYLLLLHRLENLYDTLLIVDNINALENLGILAPTYKESSESAA